VASLPSPSEQPVTGVSAGFFPCGRLLVLTGQPAGGERRSKQPTGSAKLYPSRLTTLAFTVLEASGLWAGGAGRLAPPQAAALAFATVGEWVFVGYASFGSAAESQVIGVASSGPRPKSWPSGMSRRTATRGDGRPGWSGTAPAGFARGRCAR
jgi:hypothetical protein